MSAYCDEMGGGSLSPRVGVRQKALSLLARRDHSVAELRKKLLQKGYSVQEIEPIILDFCAKGWLDDQRFCHQYVRYHQEKGFGPLKIRASLQLLDISPTFISDALEAAPLCWEDLARRVTEKKIGNLDKIPLQAIGRLSRFLAGRGFEWDTIRRILND